VTGNGGGLLARVRVIEPEDDFSDMLEFDPAKIARGIEAGRRAVEAHWPSLQVALR
jgi:NTE family protein